MFVSEVVNVRADEKYINPETGAFDMKKADLLVYVPGKYYGLADLIGHFGWSVKKK
jgi:flavin reductase (DIM6/NTAB) family NADH-FMN oxidoreductase RutF